MKRNFFSVFLIFLFVLTCLCGCGNNNDNVEHKIIFYVNNESYHIINTTGNKTLKLPATPTKQGYSFEGWFYDEDVWLNPFTQNDYQSKPLNEDICVYAKFRQNRINYNINFYADNSLYQTVKTAGNETITLPQDPIKKNYTFSGWYFDKETYSKPFTADAYATKKLAQNISIYAKFTHNDGTIYTITFVVDGSEYHKIETAGNCNLSSLPATPKKEDYEFVGWYLDFDVWEQPFDAYTFSQKYLTDDVFVYAKFKKIEYDIVFMVDDQIYATITTSGKEILVMPEDTKKSTFEFDGWYYDNETFKTPFETSSFETELLTENITVYAKFKEAELTED